MNILVVGLGSMGKRRIRLIKNNYPEFRIWGIDNSKERMEFCKREYSITIVDNLQEFLKGGEQINVVFICSPPLTHANLVTMFLKEQINVFTEIDLVLTGFEQNELLARANNLTWFRSATMLYHKEIEKIILETTTHKGNLHYSYHVGQYLPDWHPWESYKDFFVGDRRTNACREIFAAELPWLFAAFGKVVAVQVIAGKNTELEIDYNDNYLVLLEHEQGNRGVFIVDVVAREAVRKLEIMGENLYLEWLGVPNSLRKKNLQNKQLEQITTFDSVEKLANYSSSIIENMYLSEIECFFKTILGQDENRYNYDQNKCVLDLIEEIECKGEAKKR